MDYVVITTKNSIIYISMFDKSSNFMDPEPSLVKKFEQHSNVRRLVVGHKPHGYSPSVMKNQHFEIIAADTSYSDMKEKDNRGCAVSELLISGDKSYVHGITAEKAEIEFTLSLKENEEDPFVGRMVPF